jgi:hypothetical protein
MSTSRGVQRPASRLRSAAGTALVALALLIAVGVSALMITSLSARRAVRSPSFSAPRLQTCSGHGVQTASAGPVTLRRVDDRSSVNAAVYGTHSRPRWVGGPWLP